MDACPNPQQPNPVGVWCDLGLGPVAYAPLAPGRDIFPTVEAGPEHPVKRWLPWVGL